MAVPLSYVMENARLFWHECIKSAKRGNTEKKKPGGISYESGGRTEFIT